MEVILFGLFKKKNEEEEVGIEAPTQPVMIPPAMNRSGLPPQAAQLEVTQKLRPPAQGGFFATEDEPSHGGIFHPSQKEAPVQAPSPLQPTMPLPKPGNIFSKPLPPPSSISAFGSKPASASSGAATGEDTIMLPLGMVLRSLPQEALTISPDQAIASPTVASSTVTVPLNKILQQLPSGKIELPYSDFGGQIPGQFIRPEAMGMTTVRLPLSEVVSKIPAGRLGTATAGMGNTPDFRQVAAPFTPVSGQLQEQQTEVKSVFGNLANKASSTGGSGALQPNMPEAPPPGLGLPKPKPPFGAIAGGVSANPDLKQIPGHQPQTPPSEKVFGPKPPPIGPMARPAPGNFVPQSQQFPQQSATQPMPPAGSFGAAIQAAPKIAPPPPEAVPPNSETRMPTISLAPTGRNKPPAIGGTSRIGQSSGLTSRESLAALAKLAVETAPGTSEQEKTDPDTHFTRVFRSTDEVAAHNKKEQSLQEKHPSQSVPSSKLVGLAADESEIEEEASISEEKNSFTQQQHRHAEAKAGQRQGTEQRDDFGREFEDMRSAKPLREEAQESSSFRRDSERESRLDAEREEDRLLALERERKEEASREQEAAPPSPRSSGPLKTGLVRPISKPTLFRSGEKSSPLGSPSRSGGSGFRIRPLETSSGSGISGASARAPMTQRGETSQRAPHHEADAFDEIMPTRSGEKQEYLEVREHTGPLARKVQVPISSTMAAAPIRATAAISRTGSSRGALHLSFALARWLGLESDSPVPIESVPVLLTNSPYIKGAAVVDSEGLTLAAHLPHGLSESAIGALAMRLFQQAKTAATEVGSAFEGQCVVSLGRWTLQITHAAPFYLVTFHDGLDFPPALARRLRKVAAALVRQETVG